MFFQDRHQAGQLLAKALSNYSQNPDVVILGLPRGGVPLAYEIAKILKKPLGLLFAHKLSHPMQPEYAIGAVSENGCSIINPQIEKSIDSAYLEKEKKRVLDLMRQKKEVVKPFTKALDLKDKIVVLVDDGIATGLTLQAAILDLKNKKTKKIVVAVPVAPASNANKIKAIVDEFVCLDEEDDSTFLGAVGAYYHDFSQVQDEEMLDLLKELS